MGNPVMADLVVIGRILKPFGVKGDVRVQSLTDVPGRFESLKQVMLLTRSGQSVATKITRLRKDHDSYVVGFDLFSTPEEVGSFRGALIQIPEEPVPPLGEDHYYEFQLIGLTVQDVDGHVIGTLEEILETPSRPVFAVRAEGRERLIPGTRQAVSSIDLARRVMVVRQSALMEDDDAV